MKTKTIKATWRLYAFRVPQELLDDLREQAQYEDDSINTMVVRILREGVRERQERTRRVLHRQSLARAGGQ